MLELFLARRLRLSPSSSHNSGGGIGVAVTGISLSIAVMMIALSVMTGFKNEIKNKILGFDSQITIGPKTLSADGLPWISIAEAGLEADSLPAGASVELTIKQPAIVKTPDNFTGVVIKGFGRDHDWSFVENNLVDGTLPDYSSDSTLYHIVVSRRIASAMQLETGAKVDTYFLGDGVYRARRLKVAGIYDSHFSDFDKSMVFGNLDMIRQVAGTPDSMASLIEINGIGSTEDADRIADRISARFIDSQIAKPSSRAYSVVSVRKEAAVYFNWLALLDTNVAVVLTLMALLAALTLVSSLFILVLRRVGTIGLLKALGASNALVRRVFITLTLRILMAGLLVGNAISLSVIAIQRSTGIIPLDPEAYYLDHVPMELSIESWAILNVSAIVLSFIVLLVPSSIIATIPPSKAISYE